MSNRTRETAYHPISDYSGIAVVADYEAKRLEIMDLWASNGGNGYWFDNTTKPGTTGPQVCDGFYSGGSTLHGISAPSRTASRVYKTRAGLDRFIARAREAGCMTKAEVEQQMRDWYATPEGQAALLDMDKRYAQEATEAENLLGLD